MLHKDNTFEPPTTPGPDTTLFYNNVVTFAGAIRSQGDICATVVISDNATHQSNKYSLDAIRENSFLDTFVIPVGDKYSIAVTIDRPDSNL